MRQLVAAFVLAAAVQAQVPPCQPNRFFLGQEPSPSGPATLLEYDEVGSLVTAHNLAAQLPAGIGTNGASQVRPCEITPWQTVICSTGYHPAGGWFEVDGLGQVGTYYPDPGGGSGNAIGAQGVTVGPNGLVIGAHYDWTGAATLRCFNSSGVPQWSVGAVEALAPAVVGQQILLGCFHSPFPVPSPILTWSLAGSPTGSFGSYGHVFVTKALPNNRLLIGDRPTSSGGPTAWIIRDLATGSEMPINTGSYSPDNHWADVDDSGAIWILCGNTVVRFDPVTGIAGASVVLASLPVANGLAVSGAPLSIAASYSAFGTGCIGQGGLVPSLDGVVGESPRIGTTTRMRVTNLPPLQVTVPIFALGLSNTVASGGTPYPLPFDFGVLGWTGCDQLVSLDSTTFAITTTGQADYSLVVPMSSTLPGFVFYAQVLALYHPTGVAVSNGLTGTVGY